MYEQIWNLFVAIGEGMVTRKLSIVKYTSYKPSHMISTCRIDIIFQYFVIYYNYQIYDSISTLKRVDPVLQMLLNGY